MQFDSPYGRREIQVKEYAVIYEHAGDGWSAYAPDVPGCIAAAGTLDETRSLFREALELHIE